MKAFNTDEEIVQDFAKSANSATKAMWDATAQNKVAGAVRRDVLESADPSMMVDTLAFLRTEYGSETAYLDKIGFMSEWSERLQKTQK